MKINFNLGVVVMVGYDDKRNFFRMMVNSDCLVQIEDDESSRDLSAICLDLSATGMSLETEEPIDAGTVISAKLESTNTQIPSLKAHAKVVRCSKQAERSFVLGVEILELL